MADQRVLYRHAVFLLRRRRWLHWLPLLRCLSPLRGGPFALCCRPCRVESIPHTTLVRASIRLCGGPRCSFGSRALLDQVLTSQLTGEFMRAQSRPPLETAPWRWLVEPVEQCVPILAAADAAAQQEDTTLGRQAAQQQGHGHRGGVSGR